MHLLFCACLYSCYYYYYYYYYCVILCRTRYLTTDDVCLYLKFINHNLGFQPFLWQRATPLGVGKFAGRTCTVQVAVSGVPNRLN
jgi:hypothetical protein